MIRRELNAFLYDERDVELADFGLCARWLPRDVGDAIVDLALPAFKVFALVDWLGPLSCIECVDCDGRCCCVIFSDDAQVETMLIDIFPYDGVANGGRCNAGWSSVSARLWR